MLTYDVALGENVSIVRRVVVSSSSETSVSVLILLNLYDSMCVECELVVDYCVEGDDVSLLELLSVALPDNDHVILTEGWRHGIGLDNQRREACHACYIVSVLVGKNRD